MLREFRLSCPSVFLVLPDAGHRISLIKIKNQVVKVIAGILLTFLRTIFKYTLGPIKFDILSKKNQ